MDSEGVLPVFFELVEFFVEGVGLVFVLLRDDLVDDMRDVVYDFGAAGEREFTTGRACA